jgi:hypothetical protein
VPGHELAVLAAEGLQQLGRGVTAEVGKPFALFLTHVFVVGLSGRADGRPPVVRTDRCGIRGPDAVADVVVGLP